MGCFWSVNFFEFIDRHRRWLSRRGVRRRFLVMNYLGNTALLVNIGAGRSIRVLTWAAMFRWPICHGLLLLMLLLNVVISHSPCLVAASPLVIVARSRFVVSRCRWLRDCSCIWFSAFSSSKPLISLRWVKQLCISLRRSFWLSWRSLYERDRLCTPVIWSRQKLTLTLRGRLFCTSCNASRVMLTRNGCIGHLSPTIVVFRISRMKLVFILRTCLYLVFVGGKFNINHVFLVRLYNGAGMLVLERRRLVWNTFKFLLLINLVLQSIALYYRIHWVIVVVAIWTGTFLPSCTFLLRGRILTIVILFVDRILRDKWTRIIIRGRTNFLVWAKRLHRLKLRRILLLLVLFCFYIPMSKVFVCFWIFSVRACLLLCCVEIALLLVTRGFLILKLSVVTIIYLARRTAFVTILLFNWLTLAK